MEKKISTIGNKGLFTKEIDEAQLNFKIDIGVHSLKDLPTKLPEGLIIGAVLKRDDPYDLIMTRDKVKLKAVFHIPGRIADMQFANMTLLWNESFRETNPQKLKGHEITFNIDRGITNGKN